MTVKHDTLVLRFFLIVTAKIRFSIKDIHRQKKHAQMKLQCLKNSMNMGIKVVGISSQLSIRGSWTEAKFWKKQISYSSKLHSLLKVHFALSVPFVLTLASDIAVLYISKHYIFSLSAFKRHYSSFLKMILDFIFFKVQVLETFKILWLLDKYANLSNEWIFWK